MHSHYAYLNIFIFFCKKDGLYTCILQLIYNFARTKRKKTMTRHSYFRLSTLLSLRTKGTRE